MANGVCWDVIFLDLYRSTSHARQIEISQGGFPEDESTGQQTVDAQAVSIISFYGLFLIGLE